MDKKYTKYCCMISTKRKILGRTSTECRCIIFSPCFTISFRITVRSSRLFSLAASRSVSSSNHPWYTGLRSRKNRRRCRSLPLTLQPRRVFMLKDWNGKISQIHEQAHVRIHQNQTKIKTMLPTLCFCFDGLCFQGSLSFKGLKMK